MMASSVPTTQGTDPHADRRAHPRVAVAMPAFLQSGGHRHSVQILDLSAGGAKLNCPLSLPTGTAVTLDCGTLGRGAVVRWQQGGMVGICFDRQLDQRDIGDLADRSTALAALMKSRE
jgi:hypothetical protein